MIVRPERPSSTVRPEPELQKRNRRLRSAAAARRDFLGTPEFRSHGIEA
jgi:hypothetical protein